MTLFDRFGRPLIADSVTPAVFIRGATFIGPSPTTPIALPVNNVPVIVPEDCNIEKVVILTDGAAPGSCVLDIWKTPFGSFPPNGGNSIVGSSPPTITAGIDYMDATLTGWTTALTADDTLFFHLVSTSVFKVIALSLYLRNATS